MYSAEEKLWSMLSYVLQIVAHGLAPLVVYLVYKDKSKFVAFNSLQSLFLWIASCVIVTVLFFTVVGFLFAIFVAIGAYVLAIVAAIKALNGEVFEIPVIGPFARQISGF